MWVWLFALKKTSFVVAQSLSYVCSLQPHGLQHARLPYLHHLPEFAQIHVHWPVMLSNHLILCHPLLLCPQSFPASGSFLISQLFTSGGQSIGASTSASVLPVNIQGWFPLGLTGLISLQSKGLSRFFFNTLALLSIQFSSVQSLSRVRLFATPWITAHQASLSITNSQSSLKLTSIESVMPSSHLILCHPLLLLQHFSAF